MNVLWLRWAGRERRVDWSRSRGMNRWLSYKCRIILARNYHGRWWQHQRRWNACWIDKKLASSTIITLNLHSPWKIWLLWWLPKSNLAIWILDITSVAKRRDLIGEANLGWAILKATSLETYLIYSLSSITSPTNYSALLPIKTIAAVALPTEGCRPTSRVRPTVILSYLAITSISSKISNSFILLATISTATGSSR